MKNRHLIVGVLLVTTALLPATVTDAQHTDIAIWSTASGGGQLSARIEPGKVPVFRNVCAGGRCLYTTTDPGFLSPIQAPGDSGLFPLVAGTRISMVIVAIDPGVTVRLGEVRLDRPGASGLLGTAPGLHLHPTWQVLVAEGTIGDFKVIFQLTASANYGASDELVITLTNDFSTTTPTAAPDSHPTATPTSMSEPPSPTATVPASPSPTATSTVSDRACTGDCNGDGVVTVDEIVIGINVALGNRLAAACSEFDADGSGTVTVDEIVRAIARALTGCLPGGAPGIARIGTGKIE